MNCLRPIPLYKSEEWRRVSPLTRGLKYNYNTNCIWGGISVGAKKLYRSKMAANGQLVLPKELRDALDLAGGDVLIIQAEDQGNGLIEITIQRPRTNFRALIGQWSRKKGSKSVTVDDWSDDLKALDDEEMK